MFVTTDEPISKVLPVLLNKTFAVLRTIWLVSVAMAPVPRTITPDRLFVATLAPLPIMVLLEPIVLVQPAQRPKKLLELPVVL